MANFIKSVMGFLLLWGLVSHAGAYDPSYITATLSQML